MSAHVHCPRAAGFVRTTLRVLAAGLVAASVPIARAADVTAPAPVAGVHAQKAGADVQLSWSAVTTDATGHVEAVAQYRVYRGSVPNFTPDRVGATNRIGTPAGPVFTDPGVAGTGTSYYYLVSAVDVAGNEGVTKPSLITSPPVLSGSYTNTTIELNWTALPPAPPVAKYRVYCGTGSGVYDRVFDAGLSLSQSVTGLQTYVNWYCAIAAVDSAGNESAFSNEHIDPVAGRVRVRAQDDDLLCWLSAGATCPPDPGEVQRNDGFQLLVPTTFPELGSTAKWNRVLVTWTIDSRLCSPPTVPDKCGSTNPGGYNPCGDPWDRTAQLFLVLDNCIAGGGNCITPQNLELMRAITPFGTDAPVPQGTGVVPPRVLTLDVTPYAPLLTGTRFVGTEIVHFVQAGWHVTVEFEFSKRANEVSPDPPADGIEVVGFGNAPLPAHSVTIPSNAIKVMGRIFTTGHGGSLFCDGGSNDGGVCTNNVQCPGGTCQACDEFCHRNNRVLVNGTPIWQKVPFRNDCSPAGNTCKNWNACGFPSCTFPRAGWCPGYIACPQAGACDQDNDFTAFFPPGSTSSVSYDVPLQRGAWPVSLVLYWYH